ncbi:MAG: hypothetical protein JWL71_4996 [Acidobacteria bacterium]|nr:hypothetical protein [Acidobacteriota bacterium]
MRFRVLLLAVALCAVPPLASAQVATTPIAIGRAIDTGLPLADLAELTALYNRGRWDELQRKTEALLSAAAAKAVATPSGRAIADGLDFRNSYVIVVWIGTDPFGKTMLARTVVHRPASAEPFSPDLPGAGVGAADPQVFEAFLSRGMRGQLVSVYASSRDKDPAAQQLPAFMQAVASPLFATFGALAGSLDVRAAATVAGVTEAAPLKPEPPSIAVTVSRVGLPFARAAIKWKAAAKEPVDVDAFWDATDRFIQDLMFQEVPNSPCARAVAGGLAAAVKNASAGQQCASAAATTSTCLAQFDSELRNAIAAGLKDGACATPSRDDLSAVAKLDDKVRKFAAASMLTAADAELSFKNRPLAHWAFGAGSGVLASGSLSLPRVTVKNDVLVGDPLSRLVTMAFVNWSVAGYDAALDAVSAAERIRPFFGVTITPDFGLTAGVNLLLTRGIGITAGAVLMFANGAGADQIGTVTPNPDAPYALSYARGLVIGVSYTIK